MMHGQKNIKLKLHISCLVPPERWDREIESRWAYARYMFCVCFLQCS